MPDLNLQCLQQPEITSSQPSQSQQPSMIFDPPTISYQKLLFYYLTLLIMTLYLSSHVQLMGRHITVKYVK